MVCRCLVILGNADHSRSTSQFVQVGNSQSARRAVRFEENNERGVASQIESRYRGRALADVEHRTRVSQTCLRKLPANPTQPPEQWDFLVYSGTQIPHWREEFEAKQLVQVFLHYVDQNGPHKEWKFDKRPGLRTASSNSA